MCLIAIKNKGVPLTKEFYKGLARSFHLRNNHGCGFALKRKNGKTIYFQKGIPYLNYLIKRLKSLNIQPDDILVVHLRRTSGSLKSNINTHPFVMSNKDSLLNLTEGEIKEDVLFHNGTFHNFTNKMDFYSDTYLYTMFVANSKHFTTYVRSLQNRNCDKVAYENLFFRNKVVILSPEKNLVISKITDFETDKYGFMYSNDSYKKVERRSKMMHPYQAQIGFKQNIEKIQKIQKRDRLFEFDNQDTFDGGKIIPFRDRQKDFLGEKDKDNILIAQRFINSNEYLNDLYDSSKVLRETMFLIKKDKINYIEEVDDYYLSFGRMSGLRKLNQLYEKELKSNILSNDLTNGYIESED